MRQTIDIITVRGDLRLLAMSAIVLLVIPVASTLVTAVSSLIRLRFVEDAQSALQGMVMKSILHAPCRVTAPVARAELSTIVTSDCASIIDQGLTLANTLVTSTLTTTLSFVLLFHISPWIAVISVFVALMRVPIQRRRAVVFKEALAHRRALQSRLYSSVLESVTGIRTVKMYLAEDKRRIGALELLKEAFAHALTSERRSQKLTLLDSILPGVVSSVAYGFGGYLAITGRITIGSVIATLQYLNRGVSGVTDLTGVLSQSHSLDVYTKRITTVLEYRSESNTFAGDQWTRIQTVRLQEVAFGYEEDGIPILSNIDVTFRLGETTVICGPSGCGKTTLGFLVCGLLRPTSGSLLVDGIPIVESNLRAYRERVRMVTDSEVLFEGSILDNLRLSSGSATADEIDRSLHLSASDELIAQLPAGLDTCVRQGQDLLSSGQKQRICLARALLADPDVLILDEVTANLDIAAEAVLRERLYELRRNKIVILIAHRPSILEWADRVLEIRDRRLVWRSW